MRRVLRTTAYVLLGAGMLGLVALNVLAWTGGLVEDEAESPPPPRVTTPARPPANPPSPPPTRSVADSPQSAPAESTARTIMLSATRGDCWLSVRAGSENGRVLFEGMLRQGNSLRFTSRRLWLRLGAASNVEVSIDGKPVDEVPSGTVEVVLPLA